MKEEDALVARETTEEEMTEMIWERFKGGRNREWRPAGYSTAPDNGPEGRLRFSARQVPVSGDGCLAVPLNLLNRVWKENLRRGKRLRPMFRGRVAACNTRIPVFP
jgi:hypothetical protein